MNVIMHPVQAINLEAEISNLKLEFIYGLSSLYLHLIFFLSSF